jgi:hypothetical protein
MKLLRFSDNVTKILKDYYKVSENELCLKLTEYKFQSIVIYKVLARGQVILCEKSNFKELE